MERKVIICWAATLTGLLLINSVFLYQNLKIAKIGVAGLGDIGVKNLTLAGEIKKNTENTSKEISQLNAVMKNSQNFKIEGQAQDESSQKQNSRKRLIPVPTQSQHNDTRVEPSERILEFDGHTYKFIPTKKSWTKAKTESEKLGGYLVCINSEREQKFLTDLVTIDNKVLPTWIGLTDEQSEGEFRWVNGEAVQYQNWLPNQPDNIDHYGSKQNYVWLGYKNSSQWDDMYEHANFFSIVEFDNVKTQQFPTNPQ